MTQSAPYPPKILSPSAKHCAMLQSSHGLTSISFPIQISCLILVLVIGLIVLMAWLSR
jgi:hypothetical protein